MDFIRKMKKILKLRNFTYCIPFERKFNVQLKLPTKLCLIIILFLRFSLRNIVKKTFSEKIFELNNFTYCIPFERKFNVE